MNSGWIKLHRRILDHPWLPQRTDWAWAWVAICMCADRKTGEVNLTEVYRELKQHFDKDQWRHFVSKLQKDDMLEVLTVENLGSKAGKRQLARITNFFEYQTVPTEEVSERLTLLSERAANPPANPAASAQQYDVQNGESGTPTRSQPRSQRAANPSVLQEVKEDKKKEKSSSEARDPETGKAYSEVAYAVGHPVAEWLRDKRDFDFARAFALWGDQLENLWKAAVHCESRKPGDKAKFRFQDACEGSLDLGVKAHGGGGGGSAAPPAVDYGDVVRHPEHGEWLVDRVDPVAQKCEHSEKYFWVPMNEVTVVRRRSDCYA